MKLIQTSDKLKTLKGRFTSQSVNLAVDFLGAKGLEVLQWRPKVAPTPPPPPRLVRRLPNGELKLPVNATEGQMRAASVEQLKDLLKRRGEGRSKPLGQIASKF
jgi:hypothetical protein